MRSSEALLSQRRLFVQAPPDVRVVARRLRQIDLLCDVTLVFNEDESDADVPIDAAEADEKAAPLLGESVGGRGEGASSLYSVCESLVVERGEQITK